LHYQIQSMKKTVLLLAIAIFFFAPASQAQRLFVVFGHAEYASPVGKLRESNNSGFGLEVGAGIGMKKTFITGTTGMTWLVVNRRGTISQGGLRYTPVKLGIRRYILLKNLFIKGEAGLATMKIIDTDNKATKFTSSFGTGIKFTRFEAVVDYNTVGSYGSWFGLKVGFAFGL
jgi:hypothetical protein